MKKIQLKKRKFNQYKIEDITFVVLAVVMVLMVLLALNRSSSNSFIQTIIKREKNEQIHVFDF